MISEDTLARAAKLLVDAANDPVKVILFGSQATGSAGVDSDADFLVIERNVESRHAEMVKLARVLRPLDVPVDVLVVDEQHARDWEKVRGSLIHEALTNGRVLHDSA